MESGTVTGDSFETIAALLEAATRPEDIFGAADHAPTVFRQYAITLHPDRNHDNAAEANRLTAILNAMWDTARSRIADGTYGSTILATVTANGRTYELTAVGHSGLGVGYTATTVTGDRMWVKVARSPRDSDLFAREAVALTSIAGADTTRNPHFFPDIEARFRHRTDDHKIVAATIFPRAEGFVSLANVIDVYPSGIGPEHMAWICRRLLATLHEAHAAGVVHGAVLPHHVLIHPKRHEIRLVDWTSSSRLGTPDRTPYTVARYAAWYPATVLAKEPPTHSVDVYMAAQTLKAILGYGSPNPTSRWDAVPPPLKSWFQACELTTTMPALELFKHFTDLIERMWGQRTYREFPPMPTHNP